MIAALLQAARRFNAKSGWVMSSHVAMSMMLALFPFVIFLVAVAGQFAQGLDQDQLIALTLESWPDAVAAPIERELRAVVAAGGGGLISMGGVLALYFASNGVGAVAMAMSSAYHAGKTRAFWQRRLLAMGVVIAGSVLVLGLAFLGVALPLYTRFVLDGDTATYRLIFDSAASRLIVGIALIFVVVAACHLILPGRRLRLVEVWPGIVLTVLAWAGAAQGFGVYLSRFASYSATYAGLAGAMAALIFLYLMAAILIFGAEFNGALLDRNQDCNEDRDQDRDH